MTPIENAEEFVEKFMLWKFQKCELSKKQAKKCALIAVDELIEFAYNYTDYNEKSTKEYLEKVKQEIEKL
jgi:hypothetical protein